jgi:hypothetical protein
MARSPPPRSLSVRPPLLAARLGDLESKDCLPIGLRLRPYGLCGPRTASRMDRAGCAVSCGLPWYSRGAQNCGRVCSARKPSAQCLSREHRLQAHGARKAVCMRVTGAHIEWRALQFRCCRARKPRRSAWTSNCDTYCTAKKFQILGMNLINFATGSRKVLLASSPVVIIRSLMRISE